jgi:methionyl aminopeptidase
VHGLASILPFARRGSAARRNAGRPSIALRSPSEVEAMRRAGAVVRAALDRASSLCRPGVSTRELDAASHEVIRAAGGEPLFLGYPSADGARPFPASTCISVDEEIVHGVPGDRRLVEGELVSIDCGVRLDGWCADAAVTVAVGSIDSERAELRRTAQAMLDEAIRLAGPGRRWSEIVAAMQELPLARGYGFLTQYVGHGIGRRLHEAPEVPNCLSPELLERNDFTLRAGMTLAVEPMLALRGAGSRDGDHRFPLGIETRRLDDGWTVVAADGSPAVHVEDTIAVTRSGCVVLTAA